MTCLNLQTSNVSTKKTYLRSAPLYFSNEDYSVDIYSLNVFINNLRVVIPRLNWTNCQISNALTGLKIALPNKLWHVQTPQVTVTYYVWEKNKGTSFHVIIPISIANLLAFSKLRKISSGGSVMLLSMLWDPLSAPPDSAILLRLFCKVTATKRERCIKAKRVANFIIKVPFLRSIE